MFANVSTLPVFHPGELLSIVTVPVQGVWTTSIKLLLLQLICDSCRMSSRPRGESITQYYFSPLGSSTRCVTNFTYNVSTPPVVTHRSNHPLSLVFFYVFLRDESPALWQINNHRMNSTTLLPHPFCIAEAIMFVNIPARTVYRGHVG